DEGPSPPTARNPYTEPDEEFVPLQRVSPVAPARRKPRKRRGNEFAWLGQLTLGGLGVQVILVLLFGFFTFAEFPTAAVVTLEVLRFVCLGMFVVGLAMFYVMPFLESVVHGLLVLFVPIYP